MARRDWKGAVLNLRGPATCRQACIWSLGLFALLAACEVQSFSLGARADGGQVNWSEFESCGNGMDDDGDLQIDEGCPCGGGEAQKCYGGSYPNRLVGACRDGSQRCSAQGSREYGIWQECLGSVLPADGELCGDAPLIDGHDDDCDGAIDEGCACDASAERVCGFGTSLGLCREGRQRCDEGGLWSGCEGAVGPRSELCGDTLDNDCDGQIDEGCDCVSTPEECGDGIDNDCDGVVDEPSSCGTCTPEGCTLDACSCTWQVTAIAPMDLRYTISTQYNLGSEPAYQIARHESGIIARLYSAYYDETFERPRFGYTGPALHEVYLVLHRPDGSVLSEQVLDSDTRPPPSIDSIPSYLEVASISSEPEGFLVIYRAVSEDAEERDLVMGVHVDLMGRHDPPTILTEGRPTDGFRVGDIIYIVTRILGDAVRVEFFSPEFVPLRDPVEVPGGFDGVGAFADGVAILTSSPGSWFAETLHVVHSDGRVETIGANAGSMTGVGVGSLFPRIVPDRSALLLCGRRSTPEREVLGSACRRALLDPLRWEGEAFVTPSQLVTSGGCGLEFISNTLFHSNDVADRGGGIIEMHRPAGAGGYETTPLIQLWLTHAQEVFRGSAGELYLAQMDPNQSVTPEVGASVITLECAEPPPPGDCAAARELACEVWRGCCETPEQPEQCPFYAGRGHLEAGARECPLPSYFCAGDSYTCLRDLQLSRTTCETRPLSETETEWQTVLPPSCLLPTEPPVAQ